MTCNNIQDFCVKLGETFHPTLRWALSTITSVPVTGVSQAAPVVVTAPGHGLPNGWPAALVGVQGMTQINATRYPPKGEDWHKGTVMSASQVQFNDVSSTDFPAYTAGGFLVFNTPAPLAGVSAVMSIYDTADHSDAPIATLMTSNSGILVDPVAMTLTPYMQTAGLTWQVGYYKLDVTDASGAITELMRGTITLE